jgi:uncharacterized protein YijF (DUF1287 family)
MHRRDLILGSVSTWLLSRPIAYAAISTGQRLADAARAQVGVTTGYDPTWTHINYPGGDVPRSTGVCADVVIRAVRDAFGLDLQKLVHEDMAAHFDEYPARRAWGSRRPDTSIDHRRVLNLEAYFTRSGARLWTATASTPGDQFPPPLEPGDIVTWLLDARLPHIGIIGATPVSGATVVHNIGAGAQEWLLSAFRPHRACGHYRWPVESTSGQQSG